MEDEKARRAAAAEAEAQRRQQEAERQAKEAAELERARQQQAARLEAAEKRKQQAEAAAQKKAEAEEQRRLQREAAAEARRQAEEQRKARLAEAAEARRRAAEERKAAAAAAKTRAPPPVASRPRPTISLFGDPTQERAPPKVAPRKATNAPRGVPTLANWKQERDGAITGFISGSPNFRDGARITTSPITGDGGDGGCVVQTESGSKYVPCRCVMEILSLPKSIVAHQIFS